MNNENESIKTLASNLWNNFIKDRVRDMHKDNVRFFRATVVGAANNGTMQVQKPLKDDYLCLYTNYCLCKLWPQSLPVSSVLNSSQNTSAISTIQSTISIYNSINA